MTLIRQFEQKGPIAVFDDDLDTTISRYDAEHLDQIEQLERQHFWFLKRREKVCVTFDRFASKTDRILEIGGGTGFIAEELKRQGYSIEMSDIHSNGLDYAHRKGIHPLYQFNLYNPPFSEEFDIICLFDVLEHLKEDQQALECIRSMLKPNGLIILTVPAHQWLWSREDVAAGHYRRYTKKSLTHVIQQSNFTPINTHYFFASILPLLYLRTWIRKAKKSDTKHQKAQIGVSAPLNTFCKWLIKTEFYLEKWLPNIAGGSLIAVARKN